MVIFVETWRQTLVLEIEQADTIAIVKSKIQDREGLARERQRIFLDDRELDDGVRVGAILVQDDLCLNLGDDFEIHIDADKTLAVSIKASQTVRSIKERSTSRQESHLTDNFWSLAKQSCFRMTDASVLI